MKIIATILLSPLMAFSAGVYTGQYDVQRTGANTAEVLINQSNVGRLYKSAKFAVTGIIEAQPLIDDGVMVGSTPTNVLVVATSQDNIYGFNADALGTPSAIWTRNVGTQCNFPQLPSIVYDNNVGIIGTPYIDHPTHVIYFVACNGGPSTYVSQLFAINAADGTDYHAPVTIAATVGGITFAASNQMQRPALLLVGSTLYIGFGSYNDQVYGAGSWYGWIMAYDKVTLTQGSVYVNPVQGSSFWMAGGGLSTDGASIFAETGNDDGTCGSSNYPESFVSFDKSTLALNDFMQPNNCAALEVADRDTGTGRAIVTGNYIRGCGKDGQCWVLNKGAMGSNQGSGPPIAQVWTPSSEVFNGYVFANNHFYLTPGTFSGSKPILAFSCPDTCNTTPVATSAFGYRWSSIAYSSNGSTAGTGLIWANTIQSNGNATLTAGTLNVLSADTLQLVYSDQNLGFMAKFVEPTVINGKVYMATNSGYVQGYALGAKPTSIIIGRLNALEHAVMDMTCSVCIAMGI